MEKEKITELVTRLQKINWDFSDFTSSKYPLDLNSIPWYPATFISPIPKLLVAALSEEGDIVLDPFGGKGTTAIETALQNRIPLYCDLNPFISDDTRGLFAAIEYVIDNKQTLENEDARVKGLLSEEKEMAVFFNAYHINQEVYDWFHAKTVGMLLAIVRSIHQSIERNQQDEALIKKLAFSAILKPSCSQKGHFTYITDNCKPDKAELFEKNAFQLYHDKLQQILSAAKEFVTQYNLIFPNENLRELLKKRKIITGNAKDLGWIDDASVDLVITSPPYLCSQDYIKTMRLMNLFFENHQAFDIEVKDEIGSRSMRRKKSEIVVPQFYRDMKIVFNNIDRVLKQDGFFALVVGQGKSKVTSGYDVVSDLKQMLCENYKFHLIFEIERSIGSRVIQVGGVDKERVLIFTR